jgi:hypothetical protein
VQVSSLIESGMLQYSDASVDLKSDVNELVVPDNVQAVIASRLAGLSPSQQSLLQTASVIGRTFALAMVVEVRCSQPCCDPNQTQSLTLRMQVHPASDMLGTVESDLKEIVRKRLVERIVSNDSKGELQFSHKFVQESIYESCLVSNRRQVHQACAKYIELEKRSELNNFYGVIAHHYTQAEEWRSACLYLQLCSEVSERLEMPHATIEQTKAWRNIKETKMGGGDGAPINSRFSSAEIEEGVVCCTMGRAQHQQNLHKEALAVLMEGELQTIWRNCLRQH